MSKLSRHDRQAVRRFIRSRGREEGRAYRDDGTELGVRSLVLLANEKMRQDGREARIAYPQDEGCGIRTVDQILKDVGR